MGNFTAHHRKAIAPRGTPPPYAGYNGWGGVGANWDPRLPSTAKDWALEAGDLGLNATVAAALGWLQDNFGQALFEVGKRQSDKSITPVPAHPLMKLFGPDGNPNDDYDADVFWSAMLRAFKVAGDAYAIIGREGGSGPPGGLWWEPPGNVFPWREPDSPRLVDLYYILRPGGIFALWPDQILHLRDGIDPYNPMKGCSRLKTALREIVGLNRAGTYTASIIGNGGISKAFVAGGDFELDAETALGIKRTYESAGTGENAGRIPIITSPGTFEDIGSGPQELALETILDRPSATVCALLGVNAMVLGLPDTNRSYANLKEAERQAWRNGLIPVQDRMGRQLGRQLFGRWGEDKSGLVVTWDRSAVEALQRDSSEKATEATTVYGGGIATLDEARAAYGLPPATPEQQAELQPPEPEPAVPPDDPAGDGNDPAGTS